MVKRDEQEHDGGDADGDMPGERNVPGTPLDAPRNEYQHALSEDRSDAVERAADADEGCLAARIVRQHIIAVRRDVMGSRSEGRDDED